MMIQDQSPHVPYDLQDEGSSLRLSTRPPRVWCSLLFLCVWLCGWAAGEVFAISSLIGNYLPVLTGETNITQTGGFPGLFLLFWLTLWTIGGAFAIWNVLWPLFGREITTISMEEIVIKKAILGVGPSKHYDGAWIDNLHSARTLPPSQRGSIPLQKFKLWTQANLVFDYNGQTIPFGIGLEADHAKNIEAAIYSRFPQYKPKFDEPQQP
ncbi:MAG TPA: hypothetical protein VN376_02975 [Longilinea sp.]|nr:hypothetical protein [Longilinea sp.]